MQFKISQSSVLMTEKVNIYVGLVYTKTLSWFISGGTAMFDDYNPLTVSVSSTIPQKDGKCNNIVWSTCIDKTIVLLKLLKGIQSATKYNIIINVQ